MEMINVYPEITTQEEWEELAYAVCMYLKEIGLKLVKTEHGVQITREGVCCVHQEGDNNG